MISASLQEKRVRSLQLFLHVSEESLPMTYPLPIKYPGAFYHVISRCNERRRIFRDHIQKGLITQTEFMQKLSAERAGYPAMLREIS